jgi:hypothetical protein
MWKSGSDKEYNDEGCGYGWSSRKWMYLYVGTEENIDHLSQDTVYPETQEQERGQVATGPESLVWNCHIQTKITSM